MREWLAAAMSLAWTYPWDLSGGQGEQAEKTLVEANYNSVNHITGGFTFTECEEMGDDQPRRCDTCFSCTKCLFRGRNFEKRVKNTSDYLRTTFG